MEKLSSTNGVLKNCLWYNLMKASLDFNIELQNYNYNKQQGLTTFFPCLLNWSFQDIAIKSSWLNNYTLRKWHPEVWQGVAGVGPMRCGTTLGSATEKSTQIKNSMYPIQNWSGVISDRWKKENIFDRWRLFVTTWQINKKKYI